MKENWEINWKDYYKVLQVQIFAETEVVKSAYNGLARKYHPDKGGSEDKMKDINEAFNILSNPIKRNNYDLYYKQRINVAQPRPQSKEQYQSGYNYTKKENNKKDDLKNDPEIKHRMNEFIRSQLNTKIKNLYNDLSKKSKNKEYYFYKYQWENKEKEVRRWLDNYRGGAYHLDKCPYCNHNSVILNEDKSVGQCIDPNCHYIIAPEVNNNRNKYETKKTTRPIDFNTENIKSKENLSKGSSIVNSIQIWLVVLTPIAFIYGLIRFFFNIPRFHFEHFIPTILGIVLFI